MNAKWEAEVVNLDAKIHTEDFLADARMVSTDLDPGKKAKRAIF